MGSLLPEDKEPAPQASHSIGNVDERAVVLQGSNLSANVIQTFVGMEAADRLEAARAAIVATIEKAVGRSVDRRVIVEEVDALIHRIVAATLLEPPLDQKQVEAIAPTVERLFVDALDRHAFTEASDMVGRILDALKAASPFTNAHANLLYHVGFACWNEGTVRASRPRSEAIPGQLDEIQGIFQTRCRWLVRQVLTSGPSSAVEQVCWVIADLVHETSEAGGSECFLHRISDITHEADLHAFLSPQALHILADGLGHLRRIDAQGDGQFLEWIDRLVDRLADLLRGQGETEPEVYELLVKGGFNERTRLRRRHRR